MFLRRAMTCRVLWMAPVVALAFGANAPARTWHIAADGSGDAPTIQAGIDAAAAGDSLLLGAGRYTETLDTRDKRLFLIGISGAGATIVDAQGRGRVLFLGGGGRVEGLTLRGGHAAFGGGVCVSGAAPALLAHDIIEHNVAGFEGGEGRGGGVYLDATTRQVTLLGNTVRDNLAGREGGGVYEAGPDGSNTIRDNVVVDNTCSDDGGGLWVSSASVLDNVIARNRSARGAAGLAVLGLRGVTRISGNTVLGNRSGCTEPVCGAGILATCAPRLDLNVVAYNHAAAGQGAAILLRPARAGGIAVLQCNVVWGNDDDSVRSLGCAPALLDLWRVDPESCAVDPVATLNVQIQSDSPCAAANHLPGSACAQIGAGAVGCGPTAAPALPWSEVKIRYR